MFVDACMYMRIRLCFSSGTNFDTLRCKRLFSLAFVRSWQEQSLGFRYFAPQIRISHTAKCYKADNNLSVTKTSRFLQCAHHVPLYQRFPLQEGSGFAPLLPHINAKTCENTTLAVKCQSVVNIIFKTYNSSFITPKHSTKMAPLLTSAIIVLNLVAPRLNRRAYH